MPAAAIRVRMEALQKLVVLIVLFSICARYVQTETREQYFARRNHLLVEESNYMFGGHLTWERNAEKLVNDILMDFKRREYAEGLDGTNGRHFSATSNNYFHVKEQIEDSHVFRIIRLLPKGAALRVLEFTTGPAEFIVHKLAYWPNLYMCYAPAVSHDIQFRFFGSTPTSRCVIDGSNWVPVSEFRRKSSSNGYVDKLFYHSMSMATDTPELDYREQEEAWRKINDVKSAASGILGYVEAFRANYENILQTFHDDNVMYIEIRGALDNVYTLDQTSLTEKQIVKVYEETTQKFQKRNPGFLGAKFIFQVVRGISQKEMTEKVRTAIRLKRLFPHFFAGFDLTGHENRAELNIDYINQLLLASEHGIKFFFHAGNTQWHNTEIDDQLMDAVLLNTTRIAHGKALNGRPYIADMIYEKKIGVEVNPISSQVLRLSEDYRAHSWIPLLHSDFPIVIGCDDAGSWEVRGLSYDWYMAFMGMGGQRADLRFLKQLALNSINYSAMGPLEKKEALKLWHIKWEHFLLQVLTKYAIVKE